MRRNIFMAGLAILAMGLQHGNAEDKPQAETKQRTAIPCNPSKLVGTYDIVAGERGGKKLDKKEFDGSVVTFTEREIITKDKDQKQLYAASYELSEGKNKACRVIMTSTLPPAEGAKSQGLIEMSGETMKLIYALPGGKAPQEFKAGENQQMFTLKRVKDTPDLSPETPKKK